MSLPTLTTFEFDVVTVDAHGQETSRTRGQAQTFTEDLGSGVGLEMVLVPGDSFLMGAPETEADSRDNERPQHLVRVSPFFMGMFAVTQEQWFTVSELPQVNHDLDPDPSYFKGAKRSVEQVSWDEAVEFCDRLSQLTGKQYRLPSEAEWEFACRAKTLTPFYFGETLTTDLANYYGADKTVADFHFSGSYGAGPKGIYRDRTTDVGTFPPNAFGLYDMHGNVWEWCLDSRHDNYQCAPSNGSAWVTGGDSELRVLRGGSWIILPGYCRSAYRNLTTRGTRNLNIGFRVCCVPP